ncbi:MAG: preprotein translocase subunit SecG [Ruminococcaceae bacterium]|nr:preprotein translocase subunit SecG [Oscillospiraceae bacterium]
MLITILTVVHVVISIILIATVLMQSGKQAGLSGAISGGAETFFGKNKARTMDGMFSRLTTICAILFVVLSVVLSVLVKMGA